MLFRSNLVKDAAQCIVRLELAQTQREQSLESVAPARAAVPQACDRVIARRKGTSHREKRGRREILHLTARRPRRVQVHRKPARIHPTPPGAARQLLILVRQKDPSRRAVVLRVFRDDDTPSGHVDAQRQSLSGKHRRQEQPQKRPHPPRY